MDAIGKLLGGVFKLWVFTIIISFIVGYTFGNYFGIKYTFEQPNAFLLQKVPGIAMLKYYDDPLFYKIERYKQK